MQEHSRHTAPRLGTQAPRPWSEDELTTLTAMIMSGNPITGADITNIFPGRSVGAVRVQVAKIRRANDLPVRVGTAYPGSGPKMLHPNDPGLESNWQATFRESAELSNIAFLAALQRVV